MIYLFTLFLTTALTSFSCHSPPCHSSCWPSYFSVTPRTLPSQDLSMSNFLCLECSSPRYFAWGDPLLPSSVCSHIREAFSTLKQHHPSHNHLSPSVISDLFVHCLLPLNESPIILLCSLLYYPQHLE